MLAVSGLLGEEIGLVLCDDERSFAGAELGEERFISVGDPGGAVHDEDGDIRFAEHLAGTLHAQGAQSALVVKAGSVDDDNGP